MNTTLSPASAAALAAYARNITKSHAGWEVELCSAAAGAPAAEILAGEPLRGLRVEGDDLLLEFGVPPGRPHRLALAGPLEFSRHHSGRSLEIHLQGPRGTQHVLVLSPP